MSTPFLFLVLDIAVVLSAAYLAARVLMGAPRQRTAQLIAILAACNICHVVLARYEYAQWIPVAFRIDVGPWAGVLNLLRNLTPGLFMVLSHGLFSESRRFPRWLLVLLLIQILCEEPGRNLWPQNWLVAQDIPAALQMLFAGAAAWWAIASWRADLVESRRRARALAVFIIGLNVIAVSLLLRLVIPWNTPANYHGYVAFAAINLATLVMLLFSLRDGDLARYLEPARERPAPRPAGDAQTTAALARLTALFDKDHVYREPGLSLKGLADRVALPEYRLRRLIHEQLGYKNFNAFLHAYRIRDACAQLRDPSLRRTPILTIALSIGYQSVNTFNRGFFDVMGMTPSAYRAREDTSESA